MTLNTPADGINLPLRTSEDPIVQKLPRMYLELFDVLAAQLGESEQGRFTLAVAKEPPTVIDVRNLAYAVGRVSARPVVIRWEGMDRGMMRALESEGIAYIRDAADAYLPFMGIKVSSGLDAPEPRPLSAQAQRIVLNLISGRWDGLTAGELASLCGRSRPSVSKYLSEIQTIAPGLVRSRGKSRVLRNPGHPVEDLLDGFEGYLSSPVERRVRMAIRPDVATLGDAGALLAGKTALAFFSDLAHDDERTTVAMDKAGLERFRDALGDSWVEAPWYEPCPLEVELWAYPVDAPSDVSVVASGLRSVDALSLYVECSKRDTDDIRLLDAVDQLRERICRS